MGGKEEGKMGGKEEGKGKGEGEMPPHTKGEGPVELWPFSKETERKHEIPVECLGSRHPLQHLHEPQFLDFFVCC